jgi:hypothetical protein
MKTPKNKVVSIASQSVVEDNLVSSSKPSFRSWGRIPAGRA